MTDYLLDVRYADDDESVQIELRGYTPEDAENRRRALLTEIEHAREIEAPLMYSESTDANPEGGVPIDPARVVSVDLLDAPTDTD